LLSAAPLLLAGQAPDLTAQQAIASQQGCFRVTFQYEEVEAHQPGYALAPPKKSEVVEWVSIDEQREGRIVLQHVLVTAPRIKHWEQVWEYEGTAFDAYSGPNQWSERRISPDEAQGQWVQIVRGVADNPRYGCSAAWSLKPDAAWTCQTWAAKPRRDKDRDDYNVLDRQNTHRIHSGGWVHEQRNTKLRVEGDRITPIVTEVGNNTYDRIDDAECEDTKAWWLKRKTTWDPIQRAWNDVSGRHQTYTVDPKRGLFPLWIRLFWLARKPVNESRHPRLHKKAVRIIEKHVSESETAAHSSNP
jgi:hypothetical protein